MPVLLKDPFFRNAIAVASSSLYNEIQKNGFKYSILDEKVKVSLNKYFNRMCFRPTPFGLFSGISVTEWGKTDTPLVIKDKLTIHSKLSYESYFQIFNELKGGLPSHVTYLPNSSLYQVGHEYRYLRYCHIDNGKRQFFIEAIDKTNIINKLLRFCKNGKTRTELIMFIMGEFQVVEKEASIFINDVIGKQILITEFEPGITGKEYLEQINELCFKAGMYPTQFHSVKKGMQTLFQATQSTPVGSDALLYVNLEKPEVTGTLDNNYQRKILSGLYCINRLLAPQQPQGLNNFIAAFKKKFDCRIVPLLNALDPETGIGYESLAGGHSASALLKDIDIHRYKNEGNQLDWQAVQVFLMQKWVNAKKNLTDGYIISLTKEEIDKIPAAEHNLLLPPSISVVFRVHGEKLYLEQAGGATGTAIAGRFTAFNSSILKMARLLANNEQKTNPDVIFAEIVHICDTHTANIDRRKVIRDYEIPILTSSAVKEDKQIPLSDLWVTISGDRIILWSEKNKKEVIPRLSSAFNYLRNDLAAFRFLCDLQYQGLNTISGFELRHFFPGLAFYPRVEYESVILQLGTWHINKEIVNSILTYSLVGEQIKVLQETASTLQWPRHISISEHDNQLIFDIESHADLQLLCQTLKHDKPITIKEFPFLTGNTPIVTDEADKPYVNQFIASLYHKQNIYPGYSNINIDNKKNELVKRQFLPGSEWLYLKIYCHPSRANELLVDHLWPLIQQMSRNDQLHNWFFIRYNDGGHHLRIRFGVVPENLAKLMVCLERKFSSLTESGLIASFQSDIYEREIERYGPELIQDIESAFCSSSALLLAYFKKATKEDSEYDYYKIGFSSLHHLLDIFEFSLPDRVDLFDQLYISLKKEFNSSQILNEQMKRKYRELQSSPGLLNNDMAKLTTQFHLQKFTRDFTHANQVLTNKLKSCVSPRKSELLGDLMHMHLNRLFISSARQQELIIYYSLWKYYQSVYQRTNNQLISVDTH